MQCIHLVLDGEDGRVCELHGNINTCRECVDMVIEESCVTGDFMDVLEAEFEALG